MTPLTLLGSRARTGKPWMENRRGKGNALACGVMKCTGDIVVLMDADGSTFAKGSCPAPGGASLDITRFRRLGNKGLGTLVNLLCRTRNTDPCCGFNAFWREHADALRLTVADSTDGRLWGDGFEIKTLITVRAARGYLRIVEVASIEHPRVHGVSNLNASTDGLRVLGTILMECRQSRKSVVSRRDDVQLDQRMEGVA